MASPGPGGPDPGPGPARVRGAGRSLRWVAGCLGLLGAGFYLLQFVTIAPDAFDGGLILGYLRRVARGERVYFDFMDVYGPLTWTLPAAVFRGSGEQVWAVRVCLVLFKLCSVALGYRLVRHFVRPLYAVLAALWLTVLIGVPWPNAQVAYPFHQVLPLTLATWWLLLAQPLPGRAWNLAAAGLTTALVIWMRLNSGVFLLAAGLLYCFCWLPPAPGEAPARAPWPSVLHGARWLGLAVYGLAFGLFLRGSLTAMGLLYLVIPLVGVLAAGAVEAQGARERGAPVWGALRAWAVYGGAALLAGGAYALAYFGPGELAGYARELAALIAHVEYTTAYAPLGQPGLRVGLNEYYWLQLPWLVTGLFAVWWLWIGRRPDTPERAAVHGLWIGVALGSFSLHPRSDAIHVYQAAVPAVPALFVLLGQLEGEVSRRWGRAGWLRAGLTAAALAYASTLAAAPSLAALRWGPGDWTHPSLRHLHYRPHEDPHRRWGVAPGTMAQRDADMDAAAAYVDSITEDGTEILVLAHDELIYFMSDTRPPGGRYHYLIYLAKVFLLDPAGFRALMPDGVIRELVSEPPRVLVVGPGVETVLAALPELHPLREQYDATREFGAYEILERR